MLMTLFRSAGATGHVFTLKNGKIMDRGLAYSGLIGPLTTVAVVPTTSQILDFAIEAQTKDTQKVVVRGNVSVTLVPANAIKKFDFAVILKTGAYVSQWHQMLKVKIIERALRAVLDEVKNLDVSEVGRSQKIVEDAVMNALGGNAFVTDGVKVDSCSIPKIELNNEKLQDALGAADRERLLTAADAAIHERQLKRAADDRAVKEFESGTALALEQKRRELITERAKNSEEEAKADAKATEIRLKPLENVEAGKLIGAAIMEAAKSGALGSLSITSEFLAAVGQR